MKEFMTRVSDYISERREDPEKNSNPLVFYMLGIIILVIIILCLLLFWRKNIGHKEQEMTKETYEEVSETILAAPEEEELKQQYLTNIQYLGEKVEELLKFMTETRETLEEVTAEQQKENALLKEQVGEITSDISNLVIQLENTRNYLYDLADIVNVMDKETIPMIQEQISEIGNQMEQVNADISDIYSKISELETTDETLKAKIDEIEGKLKTSVEQNLADITNQFNNMNTQIRQIEVKIGDAQTQIGDAQKQIGDLRTQIEGMKIQIGDILTKIQGLSSNSLQYRYAADTNTLYLLPY